tara:strand:- start:3164 stop:3484 length:321 start_codon:yes stop_codon:yes gene_type:complete
MKNEIGTKTDYSIESLIENAINIITTDYYNYKDMDIDQAVNEITDSCVPIYYWDIAQYMAHNFELIHIEPTDNQPIYQAVQSELYEQINKGLNDFVQSDKFKNMVD